LNWRILTFGLALYVPQNAHAADTVQNEQNVSPSPEAERSHSALQITPYIWATGLKGEVSPFWLGLTVV